MRALSLLLAPALVVASVAVGGPAVAHTPDADHVERVSSLDTPGVGTPLQSSNVTQASSNPGAAGISGCFLRSRPLFVQSNLDSVRVYDVSSPTRPRPLGTMPSAQFENEAMNCGERKVAGGEVRRFALVGVDAVQAGPDDISHVNVGGGELVVVDVTDPSRPHVTGRAAGTTSTHTVACVDELDCRYAYSAGDDSSDAFSIFDLRDPDRPVELDADPATPGTQPFSSPTAGHKWNFDEAGFGTHTGFDGASMWDVRDPAAPRLVTTTGAAGRGEDPAHPGWNDFILHNSARPNADAFRPDTAPSVASGNVLLVTEEDYEQTDCSKAGSFQTWWVKRLDGTPDAIVPLDKVELADLGTYPLPVGAFCSSHWFDVHPSGIVAAGFYGGGTQFLDVRDARDITSYGHSVWGASEVWDSYWAPVYDKRGVMTRQRTNLAYSVDLVRGLDVYRVDLPGTAYAVVASPSATAGPSGGWSTGAPAAGLLAALLVVVALRRRSATWVATPA
ncbi:hypothetical protein ASG49_11985 [Marmoricola sp. Leaf446]|uniref:hypothetical protein n=1 Tax=Marmoricola sp. Leaf446 TaxID=1736379 RepID=UPI0006FC1077|nr:hypothetical protein [Marmoricola sp. Leaf446]KQT91060.1 hypothetical protein ASG49_11985 [Marmoricola sp. Leaf446]